MIETLRTECPIIGVDNLGFAYGSQQVLKNISLELRPGRHYIIAGPNGAGKSTLLDILSNQKRPQTGRVRIAGRDIGDFAPWELARITALAPQEYYLDFSFSVREIVAMGRRPYLDRWGRLGDDDVRITEKSLCDMHLDAIADKAVTALSGGEKRRCIVARALAQDTPVLLLDEPSSGLDIGQALSVMAHARQLANGGALVVTVSHDLNLAARYGHEIIFLKSGALAANGPVENVFTDEILSDIYGADASISRDAFSDAPTVSFRLRENANRKNGIV